MESKMYGSKVRGLVLGVLILTMVLLSSAHAETIKWEDESLEYWSPSSLLVDGSTVHLDARQKTPQEPFPKSVCYELTAENTLVPCTRECEKRVAISVTPSGYTIGRDPYGEGQFYRWTPGEETTWTYLCSNEEFDSNSIMEDGMPPSYAASDDALYECRRNREGIWCFARYDLETGEYQELHQMRESGIPCMTALPEDMLVVAWPGRSMLVIAADGTTREWGIPQVSGPFEAMTYARGHGMLIMNHDGVYQVDEKGNAQLLCYTPSHPVYSPVDMTLVYLLDWDAVAYVGNHEEDSGLNIIPLQLQEATVVRLGGYPYQYIEYNCFRFEFESQHPGMKLQSPNEYIFYEFTDLAKLLTIHDPGCDLYLVRTDDGSLRNMVRKGYYVPLDDVPELAAFGEGLYPAWKQEVTGGKGELAALPVNASGNLSTFYDTRVWEQEELGALPTTYAELLDCIERWYDEGKLENMKLFQSYNLYELTSMLLRASIAHDDSRGQVPTFTNDTLLSLLHRLDELRPILSDNESRNIHDATLLEPMRSAGPEEPGYVYANPMYKTTLYLGFEDAEDVVIPRSLYAFVINPYSRNQEAAKAYLTTVVKEMAEINRFSVQQMEGDGIVSAFMEKESQAQREKIEQAEKAYAEYTAAGEIPPTSQEMIDQMKEALARMEKMLYAVTPEAAAGYRRSMRYAALNRENGLTFIFDNAESTINGYLNGSLSPEELCRKLDEVVRMWVMENE